MSFHPFTPLTDLVATIKQKKLSPVEVLEACLQRIELFNPDLNAIVTLHADRAMDEARRLERRIVAGEDPGPLAGVPFAVKDLEDVAGMVTTFGSPLFTKNVAPQDSIQVERLRTAGAFPIGKTNTPEFGAYMQTSNNVFGPTRNPWNLDRTPGGSSGGSAAALVGGLVPLVTASDGGGSIRHPAAFTGCVGLKPTFRRVPLRPDPILTFDDTSVWGPLTLTVRDAALVADVTFGPHEEDPSALPIPPCSYLKIVDQAPARLRIGYCPSLGQFVQPDVAREVEASARAIEDLGHDVEIFEEPMPFAGKAWSLLGVITTYMKHREQFRTSPDQIDPMMSEGLRRVLDDALDHLAYCFERRTQLNRWTHEVFRRFDVLIMPTLPLEAFPIGIAHPTDIAGTPVRVHDVFPFTYPFNLTGHPALSLPAGMTDNGLPAAIQLVGPRFSEDVLLRLGRQFEQARPWPLAPEEGQPR